MRDRFSRVGEAAATITSDMFGIKADALKEMNRSGTAFNSKKGGARVFSPSSTI